MCQFLVSLLRKENDVALQRAGIRMVIWMCGIKITDIFSSNKLGEIKNR